MTNEENTLQRQPNHQGIKRGRRWSHGQSGLPRIRHLPMPKRRIAVGRVNTAVWERPISTAQRVRREKSAVETDVADLSLYHKILKDIVEKKEDPDCA